MKKRKKLNPLQALKMDVAIAKKAGWKPNYAKYGMYVRKKKK